MLTAVGDGADGRQVVIIGLTFGHLMELINKGNIVMSLDGFDDKLPPVTVVLIAGATEEDMAQRVAQQQQTPTSDMRWTDEKLPPIDPAR